MDMDTKQIVALADAARQAADLEIALRDIQTAAGRGPLGLAAAALATDAWKLRAALEACANSLPAVAA